MQRNWSLILYLAFLCYIRGALAGFFSVFIIGQLRTGGLDQGAVARLTAIGGLAWTLKPLWTFLFGPAIDVTKQRDGAAVRRLWISGLQLLLAGCVLSGGSFLTAVAYIPIMYFAANTLMAVLDLATDGLAVDSLPERSKEIGNGCMWFARCMGIVFGGAALTWVSSRLGASTGAYILAGTLTVGAVAPQFIGRRAFEKASAEKIAPPPAAGAGPGRIVRELRSKGWAVYVVCLLAILPTAIATNVIMEHLKNSGTLDATAYALAKGGPSAIAGGIAALVAGFASSAVRPKRFLASTILLQAAIWGVLLFVPLSRSLTVGAVAAEDFFQSLWSVMLLGILMQVAVGNFGTTCYGILMSLVNLSGVLGEEIYYQAHNSLGGGGTLALTFGAQILFCGVATFTLWHHQSSNSSATTGPCENMLPSS